jgi:hypothetical protein
MRALIVVAVVVGFCLVVVIALFSVLQDLQIRIHLPLRQPFDEGNEAYDNKSMTALPAKGRAG